MKRCECGCGEPAPIAKKTDRRYGRVKGQPGRFVYLHNIPGGGGVRRSLRDRFLAKVEVNDESGCWEWTACRFNTGYGAIGHAGKLRGAHRVSYELFIGPIPEGLVVHHECCNPVCVNPSHLRAVTRRENMLVSDSITGLEARRTHCPKGHPYSGYNLVINPRGARTCRECVNRGRRERRRRTRLALA